MARFSQFYLVNIEFLGFRYSGWQKQDGVKTVQGMIDKTIKFILETGDFRTLACSRTDAKVSANDFVFELFCNQKIEMNDFMVKLNENVPQDIRIKKVSAAPSDFNIMHAPKMKEYHYHFTFGKKPSPSVSPFYGYLGKALDVDLMKSASKLFIGTHNFRNFVGRPDGRTDFVRTIEEAEIRASQRLPDSFLENKWVFKVKSKGFMKYQIRLMMAALEQVGKGQLTEEKLIEMLETPEDRSYEFVAPGSGLILHNITF